MAIQGAGATPAPSFRLSLTDEFAVVMDGRDVELPHSVERLIAYLGLSPLPVHRTRLAGALWPDVPGFRAGRCLRTTLWRLQMRRVPIVSVHEDRVGLVPRIQVDVADLVHLSRRLLEDRGGRSIERLGDLIDSVELLPDWDDEWVVADRERYRVLRLEALEVAASDLIERAEYGRAMEAAVAATLSDPLRESARRLVIRIHLAEGNTASALRAFEDYRCMLAREIGVKPSAAMQALLESCAVA
jgi:DNA-binding SARP family transcriptional activator